MSLRQALARRGISVSMAWDAKQAADLLLIVRPEVVVVDLALPRRDGYAIVGRLANVEPAPSTLIVQGADDMAAGFAAVSRRSRAHRTDAHAVPVPRRRPSRKKSRR